jgi:segregation and condensation protein B
VTDAGSEPDTADLNGARPSSPASQDGVHDAGDVAADDSHDPADDTAAAGQPDPAQPEPHRSEPAEQPSGRPDLSEPAALRAAVEALLFVSDTPVTATALAAGLQQPVAEIEAALTQLGQELDSRGSGVELRAVGDGVRLYTRPDLAGWIESFLMDGQRVRLTQAALETLAVVAYRQPVTRARISAIRGVNVDGVVRTLIARGLIAEVGADPDTGGGLFRTTELFLEKMGLRSIDELPSLAPLLPDLAGLEGDELSG